MPIILPKCPTGYELNKDNCRCKKKSATKKKAPKKVNKTVKKKKVKCNAAKKRECKAKGKICNPDTGRCKNPPVKKTKKKKKPVVKKKMKLTKKVLKKLKDDPTISRLRSYSPTINEEIERLSISPHKELFYQECRENEIFVPDKKKCFGWKSKKAQQYLLDNLKSKKTLVAKNIRAPYQNRANCWFNPFIFSITDKGRKFFKAFGKI